MKMPAALARLAALAALAALAGARAGAGARRTDPVAVEAPLRRPAARPCEVALVDLARFGFHAGRAAVARVAPPACAASAEDVEMVVLEMDAAVDGRQFDRMGGLWIDNCKILHFTTAEPLNPGRVAWSVEKDVTDFARMIVGRDQPFDAILDIPNIVAGPYTGVINVTVRALVYYSEAREPALPQLPWVVPLRAPFAHLTRPWDGAIVSGATRLKLPPVRCAKCSAPGARVKLALFSSGHGGTEEFYYLEAPGGSPFREFVVYLDGSPIAATIPFPVVYTGGINPLLWRPLSAIMALDVAPYEIDLSAFAPTLGDGREHFVEVEVLNNSKAGQWNLDPVLLVSAAAPRTRDEPARAVPASPLSAWSWPRMVTVETPAGALVRTQTHSFSLGMVQRVVITLSNVVEQGIVSGHLEEVTVGADGGMLKNRTFTFSVRETDAKDLIVADVNQTRTIARASQGGYLELESTYAGHAHYNTSAGGERNAASTQTMRVWDSRDHAAPCFVNAQTAVNGTRTSDLPAPGSAAACDAGVLEMMPCGASLCARRGRDGLYKAKVLR